MNIITEVGTAFVYSGHSENMVSGQSSPGILVFSHSLQLQYVNTRALELIRNIGQAMTESGLIVLPTPLLELRDQIQEGLNDRVDANVWDPFEMSRVMSGIWAKTPVSMDSDIPIDLRAAILESSSFWKRSGPRRSIGINRCTPGRRHPICEQRAPGSLRIHKGRGERRRAVECQTWADVTKRDTPVSQQGYM